MPFTTVSHRQRFKHSAIHPTSILWELVQKDYAEKRAAKLAECGMLLDMPRWKGVKDDLPPDTADVMLRYGTGTGRFKNGKGNS